jgi:hypothetical protein
MDLIMDANFHRVPNLFMRFLFLNSMYCYRYHTKLSMFTLRVLLYGSHWTFYFRLAFLVSNWSNASERVQQVLRR